MKIKMLSLLAVIFFMGSSFGVVSLQQKSFNYDHCFAEADQIEQDLIDAGNSAELAYNFSSAWVDDCVNDVDWAAAEYYAQ